jgi:hypothetical protein
MGEVIRFLSKSERERASLIREAGTIDDSVFPAADAVSEEQNRAPAGGGANASCSDEMVP